MSRNGPQAHGIEGATDTIHLLCMLELCPA